MIIGVTGGVGSGKSTILGILESEYGARIIVADDVARDLQRKGTECFKKIVKCFGRGILEESGEINRAALADVVFGKPEEVEKLNNIVHPEVKEEILREMECFKEKNPDAPIVIEAALLIEAGYLDILDELWVVVADNDVRAERLMSSRGYSPEKIKNIMSSQKSNEDYISYADFVIDNSGSLENAEGIIESKMMDLGIGRIK